AEHVFETTSIERSAYSLEVHDPSFGCAWIAESAEISAILTRREQASGVITIFSDSKQEVEGRGGEGRASIFQAPPQNA
ncbi:hypothetical protein ACC772_39865, partial [Rhizobium ruizarguesonis]